jgi:hypothetical protein
MSYSYFSDRDELKAAGVPTAADVTVELLAGHLFRAEQAQLLAAIGPDTLAQLHADEPAELLALVRPAVGHYAVASYTALTQRTATATGSQPLPGTKENTNTEKLNAQHLAAMDAAGAEAIDLVLAYLEQHPAEYEAWHASEYCTLAPGAYFDNVERLKNYTEAPFSRSAFRRAQGRLASLTTKHVLPVVGRELHRRLVAELTNPQHKEALGFIRTALAGYLVATSYDLTHAADCALVELRWLLQADPEKYPEFLSSPSYVQTELGAQTTKNCFVAAF